MKGSLSLPAEQTVQTQPVPQVSESGCAHLWTEANCTDPRTCRICGEISGEPLGHQWADATYSSPKTCSRCGLTEGSPLGEVGDLVAFGRYEQDNNVSNGAEPIVWEILEIRDNDILVISQSAIDCQRYHAKYVAVTWQTSSIRQWLNGTFFNAAFSLEEQEQILTTDMKAAPNPWYDTEPGMDTQDRIFL